MTPAPDGDETPRVYAVRLAPGVAAWITAQGRRIAGEADPPAADAWEQGLLDAIASLATFPERCAVAAEDALFPSGTLRLLLYRRTRRGAAWRVLFTVREADADDPPTVRVHLIRHAAQAPLAEWPAPEIA